MGFSITTDPAGSGGAGSVKYDPMLVAAIAEAIWAGQGLAKPGQDPKSAAIRDTSDTSAMVAATKPAAGSASDDFRLAVVAWMFAQDPPRMVVPDGLSVNGAVFDAAIKGTPDGYDGLTVRGTTDYADPDAGPFRFGSWVGKPNAQAGRKRTKNGNGHAVDSAVASATDAGTEGGSDPGTDDTGKTPETD